MHVGISTIAALFTKRRLLSVLAMADLYNAADICCQLNVNNSTR